MVQKFLSFLFSSSIGSRRCVSFFDLALRCLVFSHVLRFFVGVSISCYVFLYDLSNMMFNRSGLNT